MEWRPPFNAMVMIIIFSNILHFRFFYQFIFLCTDRSMKISYSQPSPILSNLSRGFAAHNFQVLFTERLNYQVHYGNSLIL